jgi:hypothetical protein
VPLSLRCCNWPHIWGEGVCYKWNTLPLYLAVRYFPPWWHQIKQRTLKVQAPCPEGYIQIGQGSQPYRTHKFFWFGGAPPLGFTLSVNCV